VRIARNPLKIDVFCTFPFTPGLRIPYDAVVNACLSLFAHWRTKENATTSGELDFRQRSNMAAAKMTQSQLIKKLAETVGVPSKVAKAFTTAYADMAIAETKKNGVTVLPGIGRLVRVDRKARMGRNPATGEAIKIPAKKVVKFRVAKAVKDAIVPPKKK
jgi:DNA-binding protein HU-beta